MVKFRLDIKHDYYSWIMNIYNLSYKWLILNYLFIYLIWAFRSLQTSRLSAAAAAAMNCVMYGTFIIIDYLNQQIQICDMSRITHPCSIAATTKELLLSKSKIKKSISIFTALVHSSRTSKAKWESIIHFPHCSKLVTLQTFSNCRMDSARLDTFFLITKDCSVSMDCSV